MGDNGEAESDVTLQPKKRTFLLLYGECGMISQAALKAGIHRTTHYDWLENDPEYAKQFAVSRKVVAGRLEDEAYRRAVEGVEKPVYQGGKKVGGIREYSDTLLIVLLKANDPDRFIERRAIEHSGKLDIYGHPDGGDELREVAERIAARSRLISGGPADQGGDGNGQAR